MGWLLRFPTPTDDGPTDRATDRPPADAVAEIAGSLLWDLGATGLFDAPDGTTVAGFETEAEARAASGRLARLDGIDPTGHRIEPAPTITDNDAATGPVIVRYETASGPDEFELVTASAFGHGAHPTTALALDLMATVSIRDAVVFDVGTGTGVLAIAAARAGAASVLAVDNDPVAVAAAERNIASAEAESSTGTGAGPAGGPGGITVTGRPVAELTASTRSGFDLVLVNVLLPVHRQLGPDLAAVVAPGGRLITSGHLQEQEAAVVAGYPGLSLLDRRTSGDWSATVLGSVS